MDPEQLRDLGEREKPATAKARVVVLESVGASQEIEDLRAEALGHARSPPRRVEYLDGLRVGMIRPGFPADIDLHWVLLPNSFLKSGGLFFLHRQFELDG